MRGKNKKGVSEVVGYILLVSFAIFMSVLVYQGLKTYIPVKNLECPEGVSIFITRAKCVEGDESETYNLYLTIQNNGRHNIAGYFLHASTNPNETIASKNLVDYLIQEGTSIHVLGNAILLGKSTENSLKLNEEAPTMLFKNLPKVYSIDILPVRFQTENNRLRTVSCGNAIVVEKINCP